MNPSYYVLFLLVFLIIFFSLKKKRNRILRRIRRKRKGSVQMNQELLNGFVGKNCIIKGSDTIQCVQGEIKRIEGNWMEVETKQGKELLNIDFIERIQEYPLKKKR